MLPPTQKANDFRCWSSNTKLHHLKALFDTCLIAFLFGFSKLYVKGLTVCAVPGLKTSETPAEIQHCDWTRRFIYGSRRRCQKASADAPLPTSHHFEMSDQEGSARQTKRHALTVNNVSDTCLVIGLFLGTGSELIHSFDTTMQCSFSNETDLAQFNACDLPKTQIVSMALASEADVFWFQSPICRAERISCFASSKAFLLRASACITLCFGGWGGWGSEPISIC